MKIKTPQFISDENSVRTAMPPDPFEDILEMDEVALIEMGLQKWGRAKGADGEKDESSPVLFLFPAEWYSHIPEGFEIVDIRFNIEKFSPGITDDDSRFGCLAYGLLR